MLIRILAAHRRDGSDVFDYISSAKTWLRVNERPRRRIAGAGI